MDALARREVDITREQNGLGSALLILGRMCIPRSVYLSNHSIKASVENPSEARVYGQMNVISVVVVLLPKDRCRKKNTGHHADIAWRCVKPPRGQLKK